MSPFAGTCGERGAAEGTLRAPSPTCAAEPLQALVERKDVVPWAPGVLPGWAAQLGAFLLPVLAVGLQPRVTTPVCRPRARSAQMDTQAQLCLFASWPRADGRDGSCVGLFTPGSSLLTVGQGAQPARSPWGSRDLSLLAPGPAWLGPDVSCRLSP